MRRTLRVATTLVAVPVFVVLGSGAALAHNCANASKPMASGVRIVVGPNDTLTFNSAGLQRQFETDTEAAIERFAGLIGIDFDGDGDVDMTTYIVGPDGEVPTQAQQNGAECKGIVTIGAYFACAMA